MAIQMATAVPPYPGPDKRQGGTQFERTLSPLFPREITLTGSVFDFLSRWITIVNLQRQQGQGRCSELAARGTNKTHILSPTSVRRFVVTSVLQLDQQVTHLWVPNLVPLVPPRRNMARVA